MKKRKKHPATHRPMAEPQKTMITPKVAPEKVKAKVQRGMKVDSPKPQYRGA